MVARKPKKAKPGKKKPVIKKAAKKVAEKPARKVPKEAPKKRTKKDTMLAPKQGKKTAPPKKVRQEIEKKPVKKPEPKGKMKPVAEKMKKTENKKDDFRSAFMKSLESKRKELKETLERLIHSRKEYEGELTAGDFIDEVDDAQREISAYSQFSLIERKNKELKKIAYLLSRIENEEDFGICEECGTTIPRERLLVIPETTLCVACQSEMEKMDQRQSMAARASSAMGSTRREVSWESTEPAEEDDNALVEYHISTIPGMDIEETETPSEEKEEK